MRQDLTVDVAIIGAGTAGLYALREVRRARKSFVLIDHGPLGTTCARVGCMPSKAMLHAAELWSGHTTLDAFGGSGAETLRLDRPTLLAHVREHRDRFAGGAAAKAREGAGDALLEGTARFVEPTVLRVDTATGPVTVRAGAVIIAVGSRPALPAFLDPVADRVVTTDGFFELDTLPDAVGVLGLGGIGLELGLAMTRMGIDVVGADLAPLPAGIADPVIGKRALAHFSAEMDFWLGQPTAVEAAPDGVRLISGTRSRTVGLLLAALGRRPNTDRLGLAQAGFPLGPRGEVAFDPASLQVGDLPVFIAGDAAADRPLMHEAADEGAIAGYNAARGLRTRFRRRVPLGIVFSEPDVATVGERLDRLDESRIVVGSATGQANGRSRILDADDSLLRVYAEAGSGRLLGAALFARGGEHLAHQLAWAIQRGETARNLMEMPFYHPTVEEMTQSALQDIVRQLPANDDLPLGLLRG